MNAGADGPSQPAKDVEAGSARLVQRTSVRTNGDQTWAGQISADLHQKANAENYATLSLDELTEVLSAWPNFGCFAIAVTHPMRPLSGAYVRICALCVTLAQVLIPISLLSNAMITSHAQDIAGRGGWCPGVTNSTDSTGYLPGCAGIEERLLASAICLMYLARSSLLFRGKLIEGHMNEEADIHDGLPTATAEMMRRRLHSGVLFSYLNDLGQVDEFMNVSYDGLLHLLNIWLIFQSQGIINLISNSLITQFAMSLDDEFKALYFQYQNAAIRSIIARGWHRAGSGLQNDRFRCGFNVRTCCCMLLYPPEIFISALLGVLVPITSLVCVVYVPLCKP